MKDRQKSETVQFNIITLTGTITFICKVYIRIHKLNVTNRHTKQQNQRLNFL